MSETAINGRDLMRLRRTDAIDPHTEHGSKLLLGLGGAAIAL